MFTLSRSVAGPAPADFLSIIAAAACAGSRSRRRRGSVPSVRSTWRRTAAWRLSGSQPGWTFP
eukprot:scaffold348560_cov17-Prasinocladus_malaysianus.AAC.1